jgi:SAM-dependent methyltransferase
MARQQIENMRGEVTFRRKLYEQQVGGARLFEDEFDAEGMERIMHERMADTVRDIGELRARGLPVSPYVEIGAERGQRALALENKLECEGAAVDLSLDLLKSCEHYRARFGLTRGPLRVCADAHRLPFASGSVPFVFCYQTLHHFPDPAPIVAEAHRVLAPGGYFFFDEEPYSTAFHLDLYTVKTGICVAEGRSRLLRLVDRFFAEKVTNEEAYGVIENDRIPLQVWRHALVPFAEVRLTLRPGHMKVDSDAEHNLVKRALTYPARLQVDPDAERNPVKRMLAYLLGGAISGVCRKAGRYDPSSAQPVESSLVSPAGLAEGIERPLSHTGASFASGQAGDDYPIEEGIAVLIESATRRQLYPKLASA